MSLLLARLRAEIAQEGPLTVAQFMARALYDPVDGYYRRGATVGADGDFITAPEISQMFGELIGLWTAQTHADLGAPSVLHLIELGPGRGTMMADGLRALRAVPAAAAAAQVTLVEVHEGLTTLQRERVPAARWVETLDDAPQGPAVILANEWLDCLPIRQFVRDRGAWRERLVGLAGEGLGFGLAAEPAPASVGLPEPAPEGAVAELRPALEGIVAALAARFTAHPGRALFIDYGAPEASFGDTLQAVRRHAKVHPLDAPGADDLSAHVDFAAFAAHARAQGLDVAGPIGQGAFLEALGLSARTAALARARPDRAEALEAARDRLAAPEAMGTLFQVLCLSSPGLAPVAGFA